RPGDWTLSNSTPVTIEKSQEERVVREKHILGRKVVLKPNANTVTPVRFSKGDVVYYKTHHLSKAHKDFHAGFAPKWWGPVTLARQVGKGVFLTDQQLTAKLHEQCPFTNHHFSDKMSSQNSSSQQQAEKWQRVADLIAQLGLVPSDQDQPRTAAQVARMTTRHLLQDPVRAAIYIRGWADRTTDIERWLQPQPTATAVNNRNNPQSRPPRPPPTRSAAQQVSTRPTRAPVPAPPRDLQPVPGPSRVRHRYKCTPSGGLAGEHDTARNGRQYKVQASQRPVGTLSTATTAYDDTT
ncbi:proteoglycan 4-like, partial [Aphis craccivora]